VTKSVIGKVVDATVIVGPEGPDGDGDTYYVYGKDKKLLVSEARALTSPAGILSAISGRADKVSPAGDIANANAKIVRVTPATSGNDLLNGDPGVYTVTIADARDNVAAKVKIIVLSGNGPTIDAPSPIVVPMDLNNHGDLSRSQIMGGVTASDPEDGDLTGAIVIDPNGAGSEQLPNIPADEEDVYQVTYFVEDSDGNQDEITRAVVVDGGSFTIDPDYILRARSFFIGLSEVTASDAAGQILAKSDARAWDTEGNAATATVQSTGAYKAQKGDYFPVISVYGHPAIAKHIQATVVDDEDTHPENGDQYSIKANDFRVNLQTAAAWQNEFGATYAGRFIGRSDASSYLRTGTALARSGQVELVGAVVKKGDPLANFQSATFTDGDIFLATFRVAEEPDTRVTIEVLVSNASAPVLTVPTWKLILVGQAFNENTTNPSYMSGVSASDIEDTTLPPITHDTPVDNTTEGAYKVTYSVMDSDSNTASKAGVVLVGGWDPPVSGYAIIAHDFEKLVGDVTGTSAEAISYANAHGVDLRQEIEDPNDPGKTIVNPEFGSPVEVIVANLGGYTSAVGTYDITYAIKDAPACNTTKEARVTGGNGPVLTVPGWKHIATGQLFPEGAWTDDPMANPSYRGGVSATDAEDGNITSQITHDNTVVPGVDGPYVVTYEVSDADSNRVTKAGLVLVGGEPGATYAIWAYDFSKTVGQVTGTNAEMISSAKAYAICIDPSDPNYGKPGTVIVSSHGGYPSKTAGTFDITFSVAEDQTARKTIKATVGKGNMPTLSVPAYKQVDSGAVFGQAQYMSGVSAADAEDGNLTNRITHNNPVNTSVDGFYAVNYEVKDSDGNIARNTTIVFVGPWIIKDGYAINAYAFSKRVSQVLGTTSEMISAARAQAVCVEPGDPNFGKGVAVSITNDGGYPIKRAGSYSITFAVSANLAVAKTITATVTRGAAPVLTVPMTRTVPIGGAVNYIQGVIATDAEDGTITNKVIHNSPVSTSNPGAYRVTYSVTDSDGNMVQKDGIILVGTGWVVKGGYALYAEGFARRLSAITGTRSEAIRLSKAMAVWIANTASADFGKNVPVTITDLGGYKKARGSYDITFAVAEKTSITKKVRASISDDTPRATNVVVNNPPAQNTPAPRVVVNNPPAPEAQPPIIVTPTPPAVVITAPTGEAIEDTDPPLIPPVVPNPWHLIDLLLVLAALGLGFYLMIYAIRRRDDDDLQNTTRGKQIRMWGQLGIMLAIAAVIVLLLTQNFTGKMAWIDMWAILFAAIFGTELLAVIGVNSKEKDEWDMQPKA
jgi:hypothetical protein